VQMRTGRAAGVPAKTHGRTSSDQLTCLHPYRARVLIPRVKALRVTDAYPETNAGSEPRFLHIE